MHLPRIARAALLASTVAAGLAPLLTAPANAAAFRWANDGDANSMDPYTRN